MNFFNNMSLMLKFIVSFSVVLLLTLLVAYVGYSGLSFSSEAKEDLAKKRAPAMKYLGEIGATINSIAVGERGLGLGKFFDDPTAREEQYKSIEEGMAYFENTKNLYEALPQNQTEQEMWNQFLQYYSDWKKYHDQFIALSKEKGILVSQPGGNASQIDSIDGLMDDLLVNSRQSFDNSISQIKKLSTYFWDEVQRIDKETDEVVKSDFSLLIYISLLAIILAALIGVGLTFSIAVPVKKITAASDIIAAGNFNHVLETFDRKDEIGKLSFSIKDMTKNVTEKAFWYEQILDAIPFPLSVTDNNMNWTFINKPVEKMINVKRQDIIGKQCSNWGASICKTEKCGVEGLRKGIAQTFFEQFGGHYQVDTTYLHNSEGKQIGHIELVQDITKAKSNEIYLSESTKRMISEMERFSKGDLTISISSDKDDDIGRLFNSFNESVMNISHLVNELIEVVEATASATAQISSSTEEMAAGAQEQSAQTSEVAGAVEEMTRTIIDTTKNTSMAAESSKQSAGKAREGGRIVSDAVQGMNKIADVVEQSANKIFTLGQNSDKIGEIVQVIDEIADQTNLLALNAAIEAARAGEQGRGFAVVADEVRKLAERTTKATKEIAGMIKQIQVDTNEAVESMKQGTENVERGKKLVNKAGEVLSEIINSSEKVTDVIVQVAAASEEQSATSEEISKNVEAINSVTQETTSGIQQIARAAEDLNRLTTKLQDIAGTFKVSTTDTEHRTSGRKLIGR